MKTQIPLFRAKKIDSDEYVEGYYYPIRCIGTDKTSPSIASPDLEDPEYDDYFDIDIITLAISVDGIVWFSIENLNHILTSQEVTGIQE